MSTRPTSSCPCGGPDFEQCCGPYLAGTAPAPSAETLMRSRYTAFTLKDEAYLLATWHASTRPQAPLFDARESVHWLGLEIKSALRLRQRKAESPDAPGQQAANDPERDSVEFVARFKTGGRAHRLHEVSRFVREAGADGVARWFYLDGSFPEKKTS